MSEAAIAEKGIVELQSDNFSFRFATSAGRYDASVRALPIAYPTIRVALEYNLWIFSLMMKFPLAFILSTLFLLTGCAKSSDGERELRQLTPAWFDALNLAKESPRNSLAPQIAQLQAMRRQAEAVPVSECMEIPKKLFIDYMQSKIQILTQFLAGENPSVFELNDPTKDFAEFNAAAEKCSG